MKNYVLILLLILSIAGGVGAFLIYCEYKKELSGADDNGIIIKEIRQQLAESEKQLAESKKELKKAEEIIQKIKMAKNKRQNYYRHISSDDMVSELEKITLPPNATKEQTEKYIDSILDVSVKQDAFGESDPQVYMLQKIDHKYLPLLIKRITGRKVPRNIYACYAIKNMAEKSDKDIIVKNLYNCPELISVVIKFGWEADVRDIIFKKLATSRQLPEEWLVSASRMAKPEDYKDLKKYFYHCYNREYIYESIKDLPGINLDEEVVSIWETRDKNSNYWMDKQDALIAADFGYLDALEKVIELRNDKNKYFHRPAYFKIYTLTGQAGGYEKLKKWFETNKDKLVFDKSKRKYVLKK